MGKKKQKIAKAKLPKEAPKKEAVDSSEKQFDFGGIPDRDLKKNLGCG